MHHSDRGIILKRFPYSEADYLVTLLTERKGKITALAKGVRKINSRRGGHLDLFNHVEASFHSGRGSLDIITEVKTLDSFEGLRHDWDKIQLAFYFAELVDVLLPENEINTSTYHLLVKAFAYLAINRKNISSRSASKRGNLEKRFGKAILKDLGYWSDELYANPDLDPKGIVESIIEKKLHSPDMIG